MKRKPAAAKRLTVRDMFENLGRRFDALEMRFDALETRFDALETRFDALETRFDAFEKRLERVERSVTDLTEVLVGFQGYVEGRFAATDRSIRDLSDTMTRRFDLMDTKFDDVWKRMTSVQNYVGYPEVAASDC